MNYKVIGKYLKKVDFVIPNPKTFFLLAENISNYKINIDIKSNQFKQKIVEVETSLALNPTKENFENINAKIIFSTIVEISAFENDKKKLEEIILIKIPTEIYSDLRKSFIFLFEKSGFKDIKIDKNVDFRKLYEQRIIQ
ncbi:protein-export chaperone SecB [Pelagibacteraceae bacterium]|nr:protein-export chaperone SecB [Pelagibacteraceae bacterium]